MEWYQMDAGKCLEFSKKMAVLRKLVRLGLISENEYIRAKNRIMSSYHNISSPVQEKELLSKEGLIMADQTLPLNVSDEMKSDDERQNCVGMENDEELCSSSATDKL